MSLGNALLAPNDGTKEGHNDENQARQADGQEAPRRVPPSVDDDVSMYQNHPAEPEISCIETAHHNDRWAQSLEQLKNRLKASQRRRRQADLQLRDLVARCKKLSRDNITLREYLNATRQCQPIYSDDEYVARIERLNEQTNSWITTLSKSQQTANVQQDMLTIPPALNQTNYGRAFASILQKNPNMLERILENRQRRSSLIRQFIWCEFSEVIFRPFCFGLNKDMSDLLLRTMRTIRGLETNFSNVLLVRNALGKGILKEVKPRQESLKRELEERLGVLLSGLFREAKNVKKPLEMLVDGAVELANMMAEEKALFVCEMTPTGQRFNPVHMRAYDEGDGQVQLCMFPAFGIVVRGEGSDDVAKVLVKANVEIFEYRSYVLQ